MGRGSPGGLGTRSARGPKENGAFGRMEGGAALRPQSAARWHSGSAAAGFGLRAQSISHSANICRAPPVCRTLSWELGGGLLAHTTRKQTSIQVI